MSFLNRLVHSADTKRLTTSGNKEVYQANLSSEPCLLQPLSETASLNAGIDLSKGFRCYFTNSADIKPNDQVTIDSTIYMVKGVNLHNYGSTPHQRALLELKT